MTVLLLTALFVAVAFASTATIADAVVRSRNAFRQLRGDVAGAEAFGQVTVRFEGEAERLPLPPLRSLAISASRRIRRPARFAEPQRAAA